MPDVQPLPRDDRSASELPAVNLESAPLVRASNDTSMFLNRVAEPRAPEVQTLAGAVMADPTGAVAGSLLAKLLPAGIGAALMVAVDPPQTKRELFARLFVAFAFSYLFGDFMFDLARSFSLFAFLEAGKRAHLVAVDGFAGACGWFVIGGGAQLLKRFKANPTELVDDVKKAMP